MNSKITLLLAGLLGCLLLGLCLASDVQAQPAGSEQTVDRETMYEKYLDFGSYVRGGTVVPNWMADGARFWYVDGDPDSVIVWKVDPEERSKTVLFDVGRLRDVLSEALGEDLPGRGIPFSHFTFEEGEETIRFEVNDREVRLDLASYEVSFPPPADEPTTVHPEVIRAFVHGEYTQLEVPSNGGDWLATIRDHDLWIRSAEGDSIQLTNSGTEDFAWGRVIPTARGENRWAEWSPDDTHIAIRRMDYRGVKSFPVVDWLEAPGVVEDVIPQFTSQAVQQFHIVDVAERRPVQVDVASEPGLQIHVLGWRPDGSELVFATLDRTWRNLEIRAANPATGETRPLLTETSDTFVFDWWFQHPLWRDLMGYLTFLDDDQGFIWMSERSGAWQLYHYDFHGTEIRQLTDHEFPVARIEAIDTERNLIYYRAQGDPERPYDLHLYRVEIASGEPERLTPLGGTHSLDGYPFFSGLHFSPSMEYFVTTLSTITQPPVTELREADGTFVMTLSEADISALEEVGWTPPEEFTVKAADGETDLYGVLFKPHDFDPSRDYPVIESNYAYPLSTTVPRTFTGGVWERALAQLGYIVVQLDARGTPGRGKAFHDAVYGRRGTIEWRDHAGALQQLGEERLYMDMSRVGITGASGGGEFAIRALLKAPDVYHVGVARAPGDYEATRQIHGWLSPYMGPPEENPEAHKEASNLPFADQLEGKLLITTRTADINTPFGIAMMLMDAFIEAGKQVDMLVLPGETHGPRGQARQYEMEAILRYFDRYLEP